MTSFPLPDVAFDLSQHRILVTNDDGYSAPGIEILERIARRFTDDVWTVAPEYEQSGTGHSLTLTQPLRFRQVGERRFAVRGTPTDSVLLGVNRIVPGRRPTLVLSGVNRGANMGEDVTYSGTVAAAMEGTLLGIPSIALSQSVYPGETEIDWQGTETAMERTIRWLVSVGWGPEILMNVNFPDARRGAVTEMDITVQGQRDPADIQFDQRVDTRGETYYWIGYRRSREELVDGSDIKAVRQGRVSVTPLHLDLTHERDRQRPRRPPAVYDPSKKIRLLMELRKAGVNDTAVLSAIEGVPREMFVPDAFRDRAYEDTALPIACGQTISQPYVVAFMTEALELQRRMLVLEIGTGCGYQTAVLSPLARRVYTIERQRELLKEATGRFKTLRLTNVVTRFGDGFKGWPEVAPFDRIIGTAAAPTVPMNLVKQLTEGGVMIIPIGLSGNQTVTRVVRRGDSYEAAPLMPVRFVPMLDGTEG